MPKKAQLRMELLSIRGQLTTAGTGWSQDRLRPLAIQDLGRNQADPSTERGPNVASKKE